ncbi:MAG: SDR family oxidoreductase [Chloroflexi bacterium]|jgi:NAD(P)-dependent dehydrogenase (short-subunit alcohol dehydrogenase family)|nr:SDR family oxidoreductase [Chloroflexota bacterium]
MDLNGQNAFITGGAIRIGRAISKELSKHGVNVAINYNNSGDQAEQLRQEIIQNGVKVELFKADISDIHGLPELFAKVKQSFGQIDILINNAGIYPRDTLMSLKTDTLDPLFAINLFAPLVLMREFAKQIPDDGHGKIINIVDAKIFKNDPETFMYRLTKVGLWEATKLAAIELAPRITVNAISPGLMMSLAGYEHLNMQAVAERRVPLKILGSPEIVAQNVIHILKQDFMTGNNIILDGGEYI